MVLAEREVKEQIRRFAEVVQKRIPVNALILFGSYARGTPRPWSDIDIAVVSPAWADLSRQERMVILGRWAWEAGATWIEAVGYTPEELDQAMPGSFVGDIRDQGIYLNSLSEK